MVLSTLVVYSTLTFGPALADSSGARLWVSGDDLSTGVLRDYTVSGPAKSDTTRATLVIVHGANPFRPLMHPEVARRYAEALGPRWGDSVRVLGWDWNAVAWQGPRPHRHQAVAVHQGRRLAASLLAAGIPPERIHLIGQSSGCMVAASAARTLTDITGRRPAQLTLLDPSASHHDVIFGELAAGGAAARVEHYWVDGPSGFGRSASYPGVRNTRFHGPARLGGLLGPERLDHTALVRWHMAQTASEPLVRW